MESVFRKAMGDVDWKAAVKRNSTKDIYLSFSRILQSSSFSENRRKNFLEACRFYIVIVLL